MSIFAIAACVLVAAVLMVLLFKRLGLGAVLGYLAAGVLVGPSALGLVKNVDEILHISELGVVFFLFLVGLELEPRRLWDMRKAVLGLGNAQVIVSGGLLGLGGLALGLPLPAALVAGMGLSMSSTAIALRLLGERDLARGPAGRAAFAVLLFQDLAVVPLLALIPLLSGQVVEPGQETTLLSTLVAIAKVAAMVGVFLVGGRFLVGPFFRLLARVTGVHEVMTMVALLIVVGAGMAMTTVGMSMALGAFLAGVLLADSQFRHELEASVDPFKGVLLGLFFMAVGMSAQLAIAIERPVAVLGAVVGVVVVKTLVLSQLLLFAPGSKQASLRERLLVAGALSQGGEFAFVLFGVAATAGVMSADDAAFFVVVVSLSMATTPLMIPLLTFLLKEPQAEQRAFDADVEEAPIMIAGFGRFGQVVARVLGAAGHTFTALEIDADHVDFVRQFGNKIYYGDASRLDLLRAAGIERARAFVLAIDNVESSMATAKLVRSAYPDLPIYARARNRQHAHKLMDLGIDIIERETLHSSLSLASSLLIDLGFTTEDSVDIIERFKDLDQQLLRQQHFVHHDEKQLIQTSKEIGAELKAIFDAETRRRQLRLPPVAAVEVPLAPAVPPAAVEVPLARAAVEPAAKL